MKQDKIEIWINEHPLLTYLLIILAYCLGCILTGGEI